MKKCAKCDAQYDEGYDACPACTQATINAVNGVVAKNKAMQGVANIVMIVGALMTAYGFYIVFLHG